MVNAVSFQNALSGGKIRKTDDNKISVIDLIVEMTGKDANYSAQILRRICGQYPEVGTKCPNLQYPDVSQNKGNIDVEVNAKCTNFQFPGAGQRPTPVADAETAVHIMMLLPGKRGADFRAEVAKLVLAYLNADPTLADDILQRTSEEGQAWLANRSSALVGRKALTNAIKAARITDPHFYSNVTRAIYKALFGKTPAQLKEERGVQDIRASLSLGELNALDFIERALAGKIAQLAGHADSKEIYQALKELANEIAAYSRLSLAAAA